MKSVPMSSSPRSRRPDRERDVDAWRLMSVWNLSRGESSRNSSMPAGGLRIHSLSSVVTRIDAPGGNNG
eukprot:6473321-Amphidinium_carterae.1